VQAARARDPDPGAVTGSELPAPAHARATPRAARRLLLVSITAALVAAALYTVTVQTRLGQLLGELILGGRLAAPAIIVNAEQVLSNLSRTTLVIGSVTVIVIALLQRREWLAVAAAVAIIGANASTQLLKLVVLDRTDLLEGMFYPLPNSFPSGHATAAASIAVGMLLVLPPLLRAPSVVLSAIVVAVVGISTLAAGWHRMADAVGGVFVATAWGAGAAAVLAWRRGVDVVGRRTATLGDLTSRIPIIVGVVVLILAGLAYLVVALDPLDVLLVLAERGGSLAFFVIGVLFTIGTSLLALGALGFALRDIGLDPRTGQAPRAVRGPGSPRSPRSPHPHPETRDPNSPDHAPGSQAPTSPTAGGGRRD
jgi:membrane-associated phospholipid phosphatase